MRAKKTCHAKVDYVYENTYFGKRYNVYAINSASENGHLEVVKYLYKTCHAKLTNEAIYKASNNGHREVVKYLKASKNRKNKSQKQ